MSEPASPLEGEPLPPPSWLARLRDRDHTRGSLIASVAVLSIPSIATGVLGFGIFQLADLRFLALLGDAELAAAGATNQTLRQSFMLLIIGLSVSSQMWIARHVGEGRVEDAEHVAGQSFVIGAGIALLGLLSCGLFPDTFAAWVTPDPEVLALATRYLRITFLLLGVMVAMQIFHAVLQGAGDATTPMIVSFLVTPISIGAEWALAFGHLGLPALGISGIALGGSVGGLFGLVAAGWALFGGRCRVHLRMRHLVPDPATLLRLLATAWQPALHMVARTGIVFFFMALAGRLGGEVQAAYTIGLRVEMIAIMVAFPLANACATLVGQNLAAGDVPRAWRALFVSAGLSMAALWPAALALFLYRDRFVALFTHDPEVARLAVEYLGYSAAILCFYGFYFIAFRTLQAAGDMRAPMLISIGTAAFLGAPLGFFLATRTDAGASGMWVANFAYAAVNCGVTVSWLMTGRWARRHA